MKKLLLLFIALFVFVSCTKEAKPSILPNKEIEKTNGEAARSALSLFNEGKLIPALETALSVHTHPDAERIIADISGAYNNKTRVLTKYVELPNAAEQLSLSPDGAFLAASDSTAVYLIDYKGAKIIKTLPKGSFYFEGGLLFIGNEAFNMSGDKFEAEITNTVSEYRVENGRVTNGVWISDIEVTDGYLNIFPLTHEMYNESGEVVPYNSVVVANGQRVFALDSESGKTVFDTTLNSEILMCRAGDGKVIIATKDLLSSAAELFSNKAKSPLFPEKDTLRLGDTYKFAESRRATDYAMGRIATVAENSNTIELLYKVSYDIHEKLDIAEPYPTAIASNGDIIAIGTYEYLGKVRKNYLVEYNVLTKTLKKREISHEIEKITYSNGWQVWGEDKVTTFDGANESYTEKNVPIIGKEFIHGDKKVTLNSDGIITDSLGASLDIGFELCEASEIAFADSNTLFITEYQYSGKSVLVDIDKMKIKSYVENGIYFLSDMKAILYKKGSEYGLYKYMSSEELKTFGENFLKNN